jgi:hypothetical protein
MLTLYAKDLTLKEVHQRFGYQRQFRASYENLLVLEPITEFERQELFKIRDDFDSYLADSKVSEGMVKALTIFPLLRLTGFYSPPIKLSLEESIGQLTIEDEDTYITGRFDLLAVNKERIDPMFWILVVEAKNSEADALAGLAQLLTYAYSSLQRQDSVWGLTTNGLCYRFVHIQGGNLPVYQLLPNLNLVQAEPPIQLIQVLKAIRQW